MKYEISGGVSELKSIFIWLTNHNKTMYECIIVIHYLRGNIMPDKYTPTQNHVHDFSQGTYIL